MSNATCSIEGCATPARARGWCRMHYQRWHRFGITDKKLGPGEERFWEKVQKLDKCWWWTGALSFGYGTISVDGVRRPAHRYSYELANGPIPEGMDIDHICHNPACVRPEHLRVATRKQNAENRRGAQVNSGTGVRGVSLEARSGKYIAIVNSAGKRYYLGTFDSIALAEAAVIAKRNELFTHNTQDRKAA